jgi:WD40 repeat protein
VDGSVTWYDLTTCEACGRYNDLHAIPNTMAVMYVEKKTITKGLSFIPEKQSTPDKKMSSNASDTVKKKGNNDLDNNEAVKIESIPTIVIGDSEGFLHILALDSDFKSSIDSAQKVKNEQYLNAGIKNVMRLRVKNKDAKVWITSIVYIPELSLIAAGLEDGDIVLIDLQKKIVKDMYTGHNNSTVVSLAWSSMGKYVCSVGERKIIVWDAFNVKTMNQLEGLTASAVLAIVSDKKHKLFIGAVDKSIRIWHNITFELIQIVLDSNYYEPENTLYSFFLEPSSCNLYTAGNLITLWSLERLRSFEGNNDDMIDDMCSILYNKTFKTLFVISNAGSVVIYNIEDGSDCNRFQIPYPRRPSDDEAQVLQIIAKKTKFIQQASLDASDRRLIVLTSRGSIQFCKIFYLFNYLFIYFHLICIIIS